MATVHFAPYKAVKYVGKKHKEFAHSLARPKPVLKNGDIVIVEKRVAHTLTNKGFGEFKDVESISFSKKDEQTVEQIEKLQVELDAYKKHNETLFAEKVELNKELAQVKEELSALKKSHLENEE